MLYLISSVLFLCFSTSVEAHGYTSTSRNFLCKDGRNFDCGGIIYEPQSLEAAKGFPDAGPPDGQIASVGRTLFSALDEQTAFRWLKTDVAAGPFDITWHFTANHRTTRFEYFITQDNWDPEAPLTRAQFDLNPFCQHWLDGGNPNFDGETHTCTLPDKDGYHVILAVWIIDDTVNAFYNMIDVRYGGTNAPVAPAPTNLRAPTKAPATAPSPTDGPLAPTASPPIVTGLCSTGLPLEAVDDCKAFVHCNNGAPLPNSQIPCANGLLFNNIAQVCDWNYNVVCEDDTGSPADPPTDPPVQAPPSSGVCSAGSPLAPVDMCTGFVHCAGGEVVPNSKVLCPAGLLFSSTLLVCDWASNVDCV